MDIQPAQILVVDDIPANLSLLSNILSSQGYKVRPATDGPLALRSVAVEQPDLILLDIKMPGMDGYEVCRQLKDNEKFRDIPVIFISALTETADKVKGFETGGLDYITKPFEPAEVLARVRTHLRLRQLQLHMEELVRQRTGELSLSNTDLLSEIAEHARAEEELRRLNRSLMMLSACNQSLIHADNEPTLLREICKIIKEIGGYAMACIGLAGQDADTSIRMAAFFGCTGGCLRQNRQLSRDEATQIDTPLELAIRSRETVICEDLANDTRFCPWCPDAIEKNCRTVVAIPLIADRQLFGALNIQSEIPGGCNPEETRLLFELADDLAFGIAALRSHQERLKATEQLARKRARLQSIVRSSPTGIAIVAGRRFLEVNKRLCDMLGYTERELVGTSTRTIYQDEKAFNQVGGMVGAELALKDTASIETCFRRKDGRVIDVLLNWTSINPVTDPLPGNAATGLEAGEEQPPEAELNFTILDISERKRMERALRDSEIRYRTIFENTGTAMLIVEEDMVIALSNAEFTSLTGVSRREIEGTMKWTAFVAPEVLEQMLEYHQRRRLDPAGAPKSYESRLKHRHGHLVDVFITVVMIPGTTKSVASIIDITEQKKLETRVRQSQKMEAIGVLAGGIAHDFNNILSAIMGYTELALTKSSLDSSIRRYLERTHQAGERAKDLIHQILTFSRQTEQELKPVPVSLIAKEVLKLLRSTLPSTIEIRQDIATSFQRDIILADPTQIHQVLMNLCTNAAYAMQTDGGQLMVKVAEIEADAALAAEVPGLQPGPYVVLSVSDTGQGMDKVLIERIFEPYFTTKPPSEGSGLGLSVVIGIVKKFNGAITVASEPGKGSVFRIYLPRLQDTFSEQVERPGNFPVGDERILFVDDEAMLTELATEVLESLGYHVTATTSSQQALEIFRQAPDDVDLIFTDMTMPVMTGLELARQCRQIRPGVPILLASGHSELIDEQTLIATGVNQFIIKPYVIDQIAHILRRVLSKNSGLETPSGSDSGRAGQFLTRD